MTVGELSNRMGAREFREWQAYEFTFGSLSFEQRLDQAAALISERITNMLKQKGKDAKIDDFTPLYGVTSEEVRDGESDS